MNRLTFLVFLVFGCVLMGGITFAIAAQNGLTAKFNHEKHITYMGGMDCATCHGANLDVLSPPRSTCAQCHGDQYSAAVELPGRKTHGAVWSLTHGPAAKSAANNCATCHDQPRTRAIPDCLNCHIADKVDEMGRFGNNFSNVHTSEFNVTHPIAARTDPRLCSNCHTENRFCMDCHDKYQRNDLAMDSHRRGFSSIRLIPDRQTSLTHEQFNESQCQTCHKDSFLPTHQWSAAHAREARKNLATCQSCHPTGDTCLKCHSATAGLRINPHPRDWNKSKDRLRSASEGRTCAKCH